MLLQQLNSDPGIFAYLFFAFETASHYKALAVQELTL